MAGSQACTTFTYDSHPSPADRISYIEKLHIPYSPVHDNTRPVLDLFPIPEELQREMIAEITQLMRK